MAWCPHCEEDRPVTRQTFDITCTYCRKPEIDGHLIECRGPVKGAFDVCSFCNSPIFAKAKTSDDYTQLELLETSAREKYLAIQATSMKVKNAVFGAIAVYILYQFFQSL